MTPLRDLLLTFTTRELFAALLGAMAVLSAIGLMNRISAALGLAPLAACLVLFGSLLGSTVDIPITLSPGVLVVTRRAAEFIGVPSLAPVAVDRTGTALAVNLGGAVIPVLVSLWLLRRFNLWALGGAAALIVAYFVRQVAVPVPGLGVSVPAFAPPLLAAFAGLVLWRRYAGPLAYAGGSLGVLLGADLSNLDRLRSLGAPVASIGGAGSFDGIFLAGVIAVALASFQRR